MQYSDSSNSYGWVSIALHWLAASVIFTLWFLGNSALGAENFQERREILSLHVSIAILAYLPLAYRVFWRLKVGHPSIEGQGKIDKWMSRAAHYLMLGSIVVLLISGPLIAWAGGIGITVFDWFSVPAPFGVIPELYRVMYEVHVFTANLIIFTAIVHLCGAFKHMMFDDDDVFIGMLRPHKKIDS